MTTAMSIKLAKLPPRSYSVEGEEANPNGGVVGEDLPPPSVGVHVLLRDKFGTVTQLDFHDTASSSSDSNVWFHQAASEGAIDQVKLHMETLAKLYNEGSALYMEERDRMYKSYSALHMASRYNRKNVVMFLLSKEAPIDQRDEEDENTPLLLAVKYNMTAAAKVLLERGANPLSRNKYGTSPLHFAARRGNVELCQIILEKPGIHINRLVDKGGSTPLHMAMLGGSEEVVEMLIRYGGDVMMNNIEGEQPIHFAAAEDAGDIIVLLAKGAISHVPPAEREKKQRDFVNNGTNEMDTALHIAAQSCFIETVKTLVHIGANVNKKTDTGQTALHLAAINGDLEVVKFLVRSYAKIGAKDSEQMTPLHKACQFGRFKTVQFLIEQGASIDGRDRDGFTPLMCAVWTGQNKVVNYLIDRNANIRLDENNSKCVLHLAIEEDHYDTLELLITKGAHILVDYVDKDYKSVLHFAAEKGNENMLKILLDNGAQINVADIEEKTPLHTAAEKGNVECVECLVKLSLTIINATDARGMSPLHLAAFNGHISVCKRLIELGIDISCRDEMNWTPLDYAARNGYYKTVKVLLDNNAPVDACDINNTSPLHHASQYGHIECINMLLDNGASIALKNVEGKNCLDLSVENFQKDACLALIRHSRWAETVKHLNKKEPPPMKKLIQFVPDIAEIVLNNCITKKDLGIEGRVEYSTVYDFHYLDMSPDEQAECEEPYFGPQVMALYQRDKLLAHPLTVKLINHKWARLGRLVYVLSLSTYLLFVALLTSLVVLEKDADRNMKEKNPKAIWNVCNFSDSNFTKVVPWMTFGLACFQIVKEFIQAVYLGRRYLEDVVNWFEFVLYWSTFLFMLPFILCQVRDDVDHQQLANLKWQAGAISILFAWCNLLLYLKRIPYFGLYVLMFTEVLRTLLNVLCVFSILVVGFALAFYSLFKVPDEIFNAFKDDNSGTASFRLVGTSLVRTIVMMIGELDYRALFTEHFEDSRKPLLPYKSMSNMIFVFFVIIMTIIVMNLLVGLAVGDIESVRKNAHIHMLREKVNLLQVLEQTYPKFILKAVYRSGAEDLPKYGKSRWERFCNWLGSLDFESLRKDQMDQTAKEQVMRLEIESQRTELEKQKEHVKAMTTTIEKQSETIKKIVEKLKKLPKDKLKLFME